MPADRPTRGIAKTIRLRAPRAGPVDAFVGSRVRLKRLMMGMSQSRLGELLGLTFQQIQKYEKGVSRIGAGRLFQLAKTLDAPIEYFFEDVDPVAIGGDKGRASAAPEFLTNNENLQLSNAFMRIADPIVRKRIVDLLKCLGQVGAK